MTSLPDNLHAVQARIAAACQASGRDAGSVRLLAVSKTFSAADVQTLAACGQRDFGENYIQEGVDKITALAGHAPALVWHCIGPIQSNKTRAVAEHFDWVHSLDRLKIAQRLSDQRPAHLPPLNVCLQVNIDAGATKSGVVPSEALALARAVTQLPRLVLRGLMTIPDPVDDFEAQMAVHRKARALFAQLQNELQSELQNDLQSELHNEMKNNRPGAKTGPQFDTLSMGMTADLEAAIHAGSTMVRVGTAIFGGRPKAV